MTVAEREVVAPGRTREQRLVALALANETRFYRSRLKAQVKAGEVSVASLIREPVDSRLATMPVAQLLAAQRKWGGERVGKLMRRIGIASSKTVGGLSPRQRAELIQAVGW